MISKIIRLSAVMMLLLISVQSYAQFEFGVQAGPNIATIHNSNYLGYPLTYPGKKGYQLGVTAEYSITKNISLGTAVLFSKKGHKNPNSSFADNDFYTRNYLEVPLNGIYKIDFGNKKFLFKVGPYFDYTLSGKREYDIIGLKHVYENYPIGGVKGLKPFEMGINFGEGIEYKSFSVVVQYSLGLTDVYFREANDYSMKDKVFSISLEYKFKRNNK